MATQLINVSPLVLLLLTLEHRNLCNSGCSTSYYSARSGPCLVINAGFQYIYQDQQDLTSPR